MMYILPSNAILILAEDYSGMLLVLRRCVLCILTDRQNSKISVSAVVQSAADRTDVGLPWLLPVSFGGLYSIVVY